jgi:hypothetical protein
MWQPALDRTGEKVGMLYASWQGPGALATICLLDPPRHALPSDAYHSAQLNVTKLFAKIPGERPFIVGLQEDFWLEYEKRAAGSGPELGDTYLTQGGLGIVYALSRAQPRPEVVRLEDSAFHTSYKNLEQSAISFMSRFADFLGGIAAAFRAAEKALCSPGLAAFLGTMAEFDAKKMSLKDYVYRVMANARELDVPLDSYRAVVMFERLAQLEDEGIQLAQAEMTELASAIEEAARPENMAPRAAWQLHRSMLAADRELSQENDAELARLDALVADPAPPPPPPDVLAQAIERVRSHCVVGMRLVMPGEDKGELLGDYGDMVSNLMELGGVLGVDPSHFQGLANYVQYSGAHRKLDRIARGAAAAVLSDALKKLSGEIIARLAKAQAERFLHASASMVSFLESLGRYQFVHDENLRSVLASFDCVDMCRALEQVGGRPPEAWRQRASLVKQEFDVIRNYTDLTLLRGKNLGSAILRAMKDHRVERGLIYCDGYLEGTLSRWLTGREVSWVAVWPSW